MPEPLSQEAFLQPEMPLPKAKLEFQALLSLTLSEPQTEPSWCTLPTTMATKPAVFLHCPQCWPGPADPVSQGGQLGPGQGLASWQVRRADRNWAPSVHRLSLLSVSGAPRALIPGTGVSSDSCPLPSLHTSQGPESFLWRLISGVGGLQNVRFTLQVPVTKPREACRVGDRAPGLEPGRKQPGT